MTKEDIIAMARECGYWSGQTIEMNDVGLEAFAALVASAEREACAKVCDIEMEDWDYGKDAGIALNNVAAAIRARNNQ